MLQNDFDIKENWLKEREFNTWLEFLSKGPQAKVSKKNIAPYNTEVLYRKYNAKSKTYHVPVNHILLPNNTGHITLISQLLKYLIYPYLKDWINLYCILRSGCSECVIILILKSE